MACKNRQMPTHIPPAPDAAALRLRPAELRDVTSIVELIRELAEFENKTDLLQVTPERLRPHLFGEKPVVESLVAESGQGLAAFALFYTNFSTFLGQPGLYLEDLYVRPAHRGSGLGRMLISRIASLAVERGCGRFDWCVLDWNEPAIRFYQGIGATVLPDWRVCRVTGDALVALAGKTSA
jgi:GNAT superfamily N-acetyltransferase